MYNTAIMHLLQMLPSGTTTVTGYPAGLFGGTPFAYSSFSNAYGSIGSTAAQDTVELLLTGVG